MEKMIKKNPVRLPTILGLFFLLISLIAGVILTKNNQLFFLRANPEIAPKEIKISNITDSSFVISWITSKTVSGFVKVSGNSGEQTFTDDRDQLAGEVGKFTTHYVTVKNLSPSTNYQFQVGSGGKTFGDKDASFSVATGSVVIQTPPLADPAYGTVETTQGLPAEGAIVYLDLPGVVLQSALVKASGNWLITLSSARNVNLSGYADYDKSSTVIEAFVQGGDMGTATEILTTQRDSPAPTFIVGYNLASVNDQQAQQSLPTPTPAVIDDGSESGFPINSPELVESFSSRDIELNIAYPAEGEFVSTTKPEFSGSGPQNSVLTITLNSRGYFGQVATDDQGNWSWSPPENLEPGSHKLTVSYEGENGQIQTIEHPFTVLAADELDLPSFTSTPSATATPLPQITIMPTPTTPSRIGKPSTDSGLPRPGVLTPTFVFSIMGVGIFSLGIFLKKKFDFAF